MSNPVAGDVASIRDSVHRRSGTARFGCNFVIVSSQSIRGLTEVEDAHPHDMDAAEFNERGRFANQSDDDAPTALTALRRSEERLRLALEGASLGTWHWDVRTGNVTWSEQCGRLFGMVPGTPAALPRFLELVHPDDRATIDAAVRRAYASQGDLLVEFRVVWPDGSVHWLSAKGRAWHGRDGHAQRVEGVIGDV